MGPGHTMPVTRIEFGVAGNEKVEGQESNPKNTGKEDETGTETTGKYSAALHYLQSRVDEFHPHMLVKMIGPTI